MNNFQKMAEAAERDKVSHFEYLKQLTQLELAHRHERRIAHLLKQSKLKSKKVFRVILT